MRKVKLTEQQELATQKIQKWFFSKNKKQIFVLGGYAGTGKTFLVKYIIENVIKLSKYTVSFVAPTGKAASILIQKGFDATTVHRLIYSPEVIKHKTIINDKEIITRELKFTKKEHIPFCKLIVLDEASMVNKEMMNDLLSYKIPILAIGDIGQLPPVSSEFCNLLNNPDHVLTEIVRQAQDNKILNVATMARNKQCIPYGSYGKDVLVISKDVLFTESFKKHLLNADQIICGRNSTRKKLNDYIRSIAQYDQKGIAVNGEKLICELNNYGIEIEDKYCLVNGMSGYIKNFKVVDKNLKLATISFKPDFLDEYVDDILIDYNILENGTFKHEKHQNVFIMKDGKYILKQKGPFSKINEEEAIGEEMINQFSYGYAISCHKSQGSQWDKVLVVDESFCFGNDSSKWLYTAITRAAKKLIIVK